MREMGDKSEVPIEPKEQTALLDACVSQAGVIGGGVPGGKTVVEIFLDRVLNIIEAGGYDAVWLLVFDPPAEHAAGQTPLERIEQVWSTYKDLDVSPLSSVESVAKGARIEQLEAVPGLKDIM